MRGRVAHVPHTIVTQHFYPDESVAEGNNESMYGGAHSSGYSKSRESRERVSFKRDQDLGAMLIAPLSFRMRQVHRT